MAINARAVWGSILAASILVIAGATAAAPQSARADDPPLVWTIAPGFPVTTATTSLSIVTADSPTDPFDHEQQSAPVPVFQPRITNTSTTETISVGLAMDLGTKGQLEHFWDPALWAPLEADFQGISSGFALTLAPGESWPGIDQDFSLPAWPGRTFGFYELTPNGAPDPVTYDQPYTTGALLAQWSADGRFVPIRFGVENSWFNVGIGSEATVASTQANPDLFPGVEATVTAADLTPGESLSMWLLPHNDYFFFYFRGAVLPLDAIPTGSGTVAADGVFSGTFVVPASIPLGDYQLVVGTAADRYWPAGSYESFQITTPDAAASAATPGGAAQTSVTVGPTSLTFDFPADTTAGTTTAALTTTGPTPANFTLAGEPTLYYQLSTTAVFGAPVTLCVTYDVGNIPGSPPYLYHHEPNGQGGYTWTNITTSRSPGKVCGATSSFSPFTLGYPLHDGSTVAPGKGVLSSDNGWDTGLHDGAYNITMDLWHGENAGTVRLLENGNVVAEHDLARNSPQAQKTAFPVTGKSNGTYVYTAELVNSTGTTTTKPLTVKVKDANPAKPVLSHNNSDNDGTFTVTANLWWGMNATSAQFSLNGVPVGTPIALIAETPTAQSATLAVTGQPKGTYAYTATFTNAAGATTSSALTVKVTK